MPITLAAPLDLPEVRLLADRMLEEGTVSIEVESTLRTTQGHRCGRDNDRFHGFDRPIRLRRPPVFGHRVVIEIRPWTAFTALETLGIDEVALLKGHGH